MNKFASALGSCAQFSHQQPPSFQQHEYSSWFVNGARVDLTGGPMNSCKSPEVSNAIHCLGLSECLRPAVSHVWDAYSE